VDSRGRSSAVDVTIRRTVALDSIKSDHCALREYAAVLSAYELHEASEWFRFGGLHVFDAHKNGDEFGQFDWDRFASLAEDP